MLRIHYDNSSIGYSNNMYPQISKITSTYPQISTNKLLDVDISDFNTTETLIKIFRMTAII